MLAIPDEVKALFSSDTVHKNFHVHFPNGETTDLNNENVISESVTFTESLCSQQYFKFGLAEASQIEFTAVGIPNIRGVYIECAIEIDCTSLGDEWAEDNPIDPTLDFLTPQTCEYQGKTYYRVPYGRFKVDTCPRDHGAMWQRVVTAYTETSREAVSSEFLDWKDKQFGTGQQYTPKMSPLLYSAVYEDRPDALLAHGYSKEEFDYIYVPENPPVGNYDSRYLSLVNTYGYHVPLSFHAYTGSVSIYQWNVVTSNPEAVLAVDVIDRKNYILSGFRTWLESYDIDAVQSGFDSMDALLEWLWDTYLKKETQADPMLPTIYLECAYSHLRYIPDSGNDGAEYGNERTFVVDKSKLMYLYRNTGKWLYEPIIGFGQTVGSLPDLREEQIVRFTPDKLYVYTPTTYSALDGISLPLQSTLKTKKTWGNAYSFVNAYSLYETLTGFAEITGTFYAPRRDGSYEFFKMSENPTAIPISRSDWSEFWWDETPIDAIGKVKVIYATSEDDQDQVFTIGSGNSIYSMEDNEVIAESELDSGTIQNILDTYFAPNASVVNFTPVDLEMRGLPYLESGDYIQLTAEDGTQVETYILSQTISGIQHLTATVTSTNGELLEVIDE